MTFIRAITLLLLCGPWLATPAQTIKVPGSQPCPSGYSSIRIDCSKKNSHNRGCRRSFVISTGAASTVAMARERFATLNKIRGISSGKSGRINTGKTPGN